MTDEYISRKAALMQLMQDGCSAKNLQSISEMPAADVAEVVHAYWIEDGDTQICSNCGEEHEWDAYRASFCDTCGAKMDGGFDDATS